MLTLSRVPACGQTIAAVPPLTPSRLFTSWVAEPFGIVLVAALSVGYAVLLLRARRRGAPWSRGRAALYYILGVGSLAFALCGAPAAYRSFVFWMAALQAGILSAVTPVGLALGDPVRLSERAFGPRMVRLTDVVLRGPLGRAVMFPLVASLLAVGSLVVVFFTGYFAASVRSDGVRVLLQLQLLVTGTLAVLPLLTDDLLPAWCTHPMRALFAFVDGLLDAIPGILLMTAPGLLTASFPGWRGLGFGLTPRWDQRLGGGALLAVAEAVGLPVLVAVFLEWMRKDDAEARETDARLDEETQEEAQDAPWWERDPRFAGRYRHGPS